MIYPPRAKYKTIPPNINNFDSGEYYAQPKLNGCCSALIMTPKNYQLWNRYQGKLISNIDFGCLYKGKNKFTIAGEYMNKSKSDGSGNKFNHKLVIWDILTFNGKELTGTRFDERVDLLSTLYKPKKYDDYISKIDDDIFIVNNFEEGFEKIFNKIIKIDMYEGLVLKKKHGILEPCISDKTNKKWQLKIRKPTNSYKF